MPQRPAANAPAPPGADDMDIDMASPAPPHHLPTLLLPATGASGFAPSHSPGSRHPVPRSASDSRAVPSPSKSPRLLPGHGGALGHVVGRRRKRQGHMRSTSLPDGPVRGSSMLLDSLPGLTLDEGDEDMERPASAASFESITSAASRGSGMSGVNGDGSLHTVPSFTSILSATDVSSASPTEPESANTSFSSDPSPSRPPQPSPRQSSTPSVLTSRPTSRRSSHSSRRASPASSAIDPSLCTCGTCVHCFASGLARALEQERSVTRDLRAKLDDLMAREFELVARLERETQLRQSVDQINDRLHNQLATSQTRLAQERAQYETMADMWSGRVMALERANAELRRGVLPVDDGILPMPSGAGGGGYGVAAGTGRELTRSESLPAPTYNGPPHHRGHTSSLPTFNRIHVPLSVTSSMTSVPVLSSAALAMMAPTFNTEPSVITPADPPDPKSKIRKR